MWEKTINGDMGFMPFNRTLNDWLRFELRRRTDYDASISTGLALMAVRKNTILPHVEMKKVSLSIPFGRFDNTGSRSQLI